MPQDLDSTAIVYLWPLSEAAMELLSDKENAPFLAQRTPPPDIQDRSKKDFAGSKFLGIRLGADSTFPNVLRIRFDTLASPPPEGYRSGPDPDCHINMPRRDRISRRGWYFGIHFNFHSGALMLKVSCSIRMSSAILEGRVIIGTDKSMLLLADATFGCNDESLQFKVEILSLRIDAAVREAGYREYVRRLGRSDTPYMIPSRASDVRLGDRFVSIGFIGHGQSLTVLRAVEFRTGDIFAIRPVDDTEGHFAITPNQLHHFRLPTLLPLYSSANPDS